MIKRLRCFPAMLMVLAFFVLTVRGQPINITGTVVDSVTAQPIAGALVTLAGSTLLTAITSAAGTFTLAGNGLSSRVSIDRMRAAQINVRNNCITITAPTGTATSVDVFISNGSRINHAERTVGSDGVVTIDNLWQSMQLYIVKVCIGGNARMFTTIGLTSHMLPVTATSSGILFKTAAVYTVQIAADRYISRQYIMSTPTGSIGAIKMVPWPAAGNLSATTCVIPAEAAPANVSTPKTVVGTGTPSSCTPAAFIAAVARGGVITFNSGNQPVTITLTQPAKVFNDSSSDIVIDGKGLVTLSGGGTTRILYMNTCDQNQHWTSAACQNQATPRLTVQNLTFINGNSLGETQYDGGGAIWVRGGRFKAINCRFFNNRCDTTGPDVGGAAIRVFDQYNVLPIYVVNCTFGGAAGLGNIGSNGGGISSIAQSWTIINSVFSYNRAVGNGGNPAVSGTPGGGSGGGIYNDGNTMTLTLCGTLIEYNEVNAYGAAIFFVSNDHSGNIVIDQTISRNNIGGSWYPAYPGISMHADTRIVVTNSTIQ